jgi:hypothetical protein
MKQHNKQRNKQAETGVAGGETERRWHWREAFLFSLRANITPLTRNSVADDPLTPDANVRKSGRARRPTRCDTEEEF